MKKINAMLKKCRTLTRQLGRNASYSSLRSKSDGEDFWGYDSLQQQQCETIFVGSSRKPYVVASKYLCHPLLNALIKKSKQKPGEDLAIQCEVVLFDHLLWMLDNADPNNLASESLEELAELYVL